MRQVIFLSLSIAGSLTMLRRSVATTRIISVLLWPITLTRTILTSCVSVSITIFAAEAVATVRIVIRLLARRTFAVISKAKKCYKNFKVLCDLRWKCTVFYCVLSAVKSTEIENNFSTISFCCIWWVILSDAWISCGHGNDHHLQECGTWILSDCVIACSGQPCHHPRLPVWS